MRSDSTYVKSMQSHAANEYNGENNTLGSVLKNNICNNNNHNNNIDSFSGYVN